ncbi:MAG: hypothetical protein AAGM38_15765 [Pseudomonadota bacterium]
MTTEMIGVVSLAMVMGVAVLVGAVSYMNDRPRADDEDDREEA